MLSLHFLDFGYFNMGTTLLLELVQKVKHKINQNRKLYIRYFRYPMQKILIQASNLRFLPYVILASEFCRATSVGS